MQIYGILLNIRGILLNIRGILLNIRGILLNIRGKSENFGENLGIFEENARKIWEFSRKMHGKSGNFRGIHSSKWQNRREILLSFPVVFARNSLVFPVIPGHFPIDSD